MVGLTQELNLDYVFNVSYGVTLFTLLLVKDGGVEVSEWETITKIENVPKAYTGKERR